MKSIISILITGILIVCGANAKPLKVFILVGQSNMEGPANISTFDYIGDDPANAPLLKMMRGADGKPTTADGAWISYLTGAKESNFSLQGELTAGCGSMWGMDPSKLGEKIGPEFTFGLAMDAAFDEPVLIIKAAWGGKSQHTDFRPPSAGPYVMPKETQELWEKHPQGAHGIPKAEERPQWNAEKIAATGVYYRLMTEHVKQVLADPKKVIPDYDAAQGYEIAGFIWLQGFNADGYMTDEQKKEYLKKFEAELITAADFALWNRGASNAGYHYLGCAKTFALMGKNFAEANLGMMKAAK